MNDINSECWVIHGMDFMAHSALTSAQNLGTSIVFLVFFLNFEVCIDLFFCDLVYELLKPR